MTDIINNSWNWKGFEAVEVFDTNAFGNVIFKCAEGSFWRICPEELSCDKIADNANDLDDLLQDEEFQLDWQMTEIIKVAESKLGHLSDGRKYCLKIPAALGGLYAGENMGTNSLAEMISFSGDLANQVKDLPAGTKVKLKITD